MYASTRYRLENLLGRLLVHSILILVSLACFMPLMLIIAASFTNDQALAEHGYTFWPTQFSTYAYEYVLTDAPKVLQAYGITIFITVVGSIAALLVMALLAYALSRRALRVRKALSFYVFFTLLFSGGLVPTYILITQILQMRNTLPVLILPIMVVPTWVLILRTYFLSLPDELLDAARIDGAGEWRIFFQVVMPLSTPALATIGLFAVLMYWNDWYLALLYVDDPNLYPLQYYLYTVLSNINFLSAGSQSLGITPPAQSARMALTVLAIGPIIFAAVFAHRYFVRGVTLGALKD